MTFFHAFIFTYKSPIIKSINIYIFHINILIFNS
mgnify:CR=1 FL=1